MKLRSLPAEDDAPAEVDLREIWGVLRRQWWILIAGGAVGIAAAVFLIGRPEPVYDASALVRVEEQRGAIPGLALGAGSHLETEMQVLRSRSVLAGVVDSLDLQLQIAAPAGVARAELFAHIDLPASLAPGSYRLVRQPDERFALSELDSDRGLGTYAVNEPITLGGAVVALAPAALRHPEIAVSLVTRERAIDALAGGLEITRPTRNADLIRVAFRDRDPGTARDVVNTVVDRFLQVRNAAQKTEVRSTIEFLNGQIESVSRDLTAAEDELRAFRERAQVIDPTVEGSTQVRRLAELHAERSSVESERAALLALVQEIETAPSGAVGGPSPYRRLAAFPTLMRSQVVSDVLRSLTALEGERAALLTRRRPDDQDVQVLSSQIADLEEQVRSFVTTYLAGLSNQVASLDTNIAAFGGQISRLPANEVEFARLSRQPKLLGEMYALLQTRLQEAEVAQAVDDASVRIVDPAALPTRAVAETRWKFEFLGISVLGLLLGVTVGFGREYADDSVYTRTDVQAAIGVPVIGLIPRVNRAAVRAVRSARRGLVLPPLEQAGRGDGADPAEGGTLTPALRPVESDGPLMVMLADDGPDPVSDAYDRLHTNILFALADNEPTTLLVTSALPGDGKTTTATNLAVALARRGLKTLLIDADLRRGTVSSVFQGARTPGLTELLAGTEPLNRVMQSLQVTDDSRLYFIASGEFPAHPGRVVGSPEMQALLERLGSHFDRIIIDTPPVNIVADAAVLARTVDGVVMVARAGVTPHEALVLAAEQFRQARVQVVGAVLNDIDYARHGSYDAAYKSYRYGRKYYAGSAAAL